MYSKDIIMHVSEETAKIMEEISEQLFDKSEDSRFDEIMETIERAVKKVEGLYTEFIGYANNSDKRVTANQDELTSKFSTVLEAIDVFRKEANDQAGQVNVKTDSIVATIADIPQLIQNILQCISANDEIKKEFNSTLLQSIQELAENLVKLERIQSDVADKLDSDDSREKLSDTLNKLSEIEKEILHTKDTIGNVSDNLYNCNILIKQLKTSVRELQENDEKILSFGGENAKKFDELAKQDNENFKLMFDKMGEILVYFDTLSRSIQTISEKQAELDKDVKDLKRPFFKRWFKKGE